MCKTPISQGRFTDDGNLTCEGGGGERCACDNVARIRKIDSVIKSTAVRAAARSQPGWGVKKLTNKHRSMFPSRCVACTSALECAAAKAPLWKLKLHQKLSCLPHTTTQLREPWSPRSTSTRPHLLNGICKCKHNEQLLQLKLSCLPHTTTQLREPWSPRSTSTRTHLLNGICKCKHNGQGARVPRRDSWELWGVSN